MLFPQKYHPLNAVKREERGAFVVYHFADGASLHTRKSFEPKLLKKWGKKILSRDEFGHPYAWIAHEKSGRVVRRKIANNEFQPHEVYRRLYTARVRIEPPLAWLVHPLGTLLVTRYKPGYKNLREWMKTESGEELVRNALPAIMREVGKMHGAGVIHGHLHGKNVVLNKKGSVSIVDPKLISAAETGKKSQLTPITLRIRDVFKQRVKEARELLATGNEKRELFARGELLRFGVVIDLDWLLSSTERVGGETEKLAEQYLKGVKEAKKRLGVT